MQREKMFGALRATTLAALCAGGLMFATTACQSSGSDGGTGTVTEKSCGDKGCGDKAAGEKSCGDKGCGDKAAGEKSCGDKGCGDKGCGDKGCGGK